MTELTGRRPHRDGGAATVASPRAAADPVRTLRAGTGLRPGERAGVRPGAGKQLPHPLALGKDNHPLTQVI
ncbi:MULTISPECIES: hypothetical protein [Streptomyces]|uniref:Uncharacterized protein n=1 Tax=Streptomyces yunnanensis TaxID=156453 RepID=A0ABY8A0L9_9ACTN|nr:MULTISPECIES: hypothetical protein [Streptomyces]WEB38311.1 hypothetical protein MOV08_02640 [Streptomyces yunnanensis]